MKLNLDTILGKIRTLMGGGADPVDPAALKELARGMAHQIATTRPDEIGCDECFEQMDEFVEIKLAGKDPAAAMPLVQDHLDRCGNCREEFEALLAALQAMSQ
jgi:hypothetical protein